MSKFHKVSLETYLKSVVGTHKQEWEDIKLPKRATVGSAGYDFYAPHDMCINPQQSLLITTGIKIELDEDKLLAIVPRSGLGFKYMLRLANTCGIIDSDYFYSDNEGHIMIKLTNENFEECPIEIKKGEAFAQGIILPFFKTDDDEVVQKRNGGFGSTTQV